ncbi:hypothetical protein BD310DRAFT_513987 [Dichomitus squalens]|uniref:Uncharacterized protein n=1 Tax=Dichomitus squalens TaxID=114155 RepID=A0A4Q9PTS7_9APHY|nr:hypothetical protein BD310DRAFT_513987 [Dichomitus squalens]
MQRLTSSSRCTHTAKPSRTELHSLDTEVRHEGRTRTYGHTWIVSCTVAPREPHDAKGMEKKPTPCCITRSRPTQDQGCRGQQRQYLNQLSECTRHACIAWSSRASSPHTRRPCVFLGICRALCAVYSAAAARGRCAGCSLSWISRTLTSWQPYGHEVY